MLSYLLSMTNMKGLIGSFFMLFFFDLGIANTTDIRQHCLETFKFKKDRMSGDYHHK